MGSNSKPIFRDQQDLLRWIDNKFGLNELWGGRQASFALSREILVELEISFQELEPHIKLKIILAILHISPKTVQLWKEPFQNIIEEARKDPDDWVETVADICRQYPEFGLIQCSSKEDSYFQRTQIELEKIVEEKIASSPVDFTARASFDSQFLPTNIVQTASDAPLIKHFTIKQGKLARSSKLLEEVKKAAEQQTNPSCKKTHALISTFPIKIRSTAKKMDNSLPMKGFVPSANTLKMSCGFTNESKKYQQRTLSNRTGGAQLIDIAELPNRNRRKRTFETSPILPIEKKRGTAKELINNKKKQEIADEAAELKLKNEEENVDEFNENKVEPIIPDQPMKDNLPVAQNDQNTAFVPNSSNAFNCSSFLAPPPSESHHQPEIAPNPMQIQHFNNQPQNYLPQPQQFSSTNSNPTSSFMAAPIQPSPQPEYPPNPNQILNYSSTAQQPPQPNILALQQFDALLKDANKLTSVTYNLIISFLSGNKSNPLQDKLGHLITLPFSESVEFEPAPNGMGMNASLVEIFFQMDYSTGEWKRLRKSRELRSDELNQYGHLLGAKREKEPMQLPYNQQFNNQIQGTSQQQQWNGGNGWNSSSMVGGQNEVIQQNQMPVNHPTNTHHPFLQNS